MKNSHLKNRIILAILLLLPYRAIAQSIHIQGKVVNEKGEAVERVNVVMKHIRKGTIVSFTHTSETGSFELKKNLTATPPDSLELNFSCIGYASKTYPVKDYKSPLLIELTSKSVKIKEVFVSAQKIMQRSDTIAYLISAFSSAEDRTIGDVLKKIPGVEVLETGEIKYQGQKLNKFYIEGSDLLEGRYGLATKNISHKDVASVEVMENHQPVKALQDLIFSGSPAMNIKLKEDAKSRWAGTIKGGGGVENLWVAEAFAMRFKKNIQSLNTYKGNNTGNDSYEMNVFSSIADFTPRGNAQLPSYIQVAPSSANGIGNRRSLFNQNNNLTTNNLHKISKDFDLTTEFTGSLERRKSEFVSKTTYFLPDEQVVIEDKSEKAKDFRKAFTGKIRLKSNQEKHYINNNLNFSFDRSDPFIQMTGTLPNNQNATIKNWKIRNDFDILKRFGKQIFTFRSGNEYASKPQSLELTRSGQPILREDIRLSSFHSDNTLDYSFGIGRVRVQAPIRLLYQYRQIENQFDKESDRLRTHKLKLSINPSAEYQLADFYFSLSSPLFYQALSLDSKSHSFYSVDPRFSFNWIASSRLKISSYLSLTKDLPDEDLFYRGRILNNYRNLTEGYINFATGKTSNASASVEYKDVIKMLFTHLEIGWLKRDYKKITGQDFQDDFILNYYYPGRRNTEMLFVSGSVSKGIEGIRGSILFSPSYIHNRSSLVRNGISLPYTSDGYSVKGKVISKIGEQCNLTYDASYAYNRYRMEDNQPYFTSNRITQSLKIVYSPIKPVQISYTLDHYCNQLTEDKYKHFFFSDASVSWLLGSRWELALSANNLLNEKRYAYFIENELTSFYQSYTIRPRDILVSALYRF